jgi:hypothetical protein
LLKVILDRVAGGGGGKGVYLLDGLQTRGIYFGVTTGHHEMWFLWFTISPYDDRGRCARSARLSPFRADAESAFVYRPIDPHNSFTSLDVIFQQGLCRTEKGNYRLSKKI